MLEWLKRKSKDPLSVSIGVQKKKGRQVRYVEGIRKKKGGIIMMFFEGISKMKWLLVIGLVLFIVLRIIGTVEPVYAQSHHHHGHFWIGPPVGPLISPPVILGTPLPLYHQPYYRPPFEYPYNYPHYCPRSYPEYEWVPGYWEQYWRNPYYGYPCYGYWEQIWIPGYWR